METKYEYFLKHKIFGEKQVSREEWIEAEREAGFYPKYVRGDVPATGGFSIGGLSGSIRPAAEEHGAFDLVRVNSNQSSLRDNLRKKGIL